MFARSTKLVLALALAGAAGWAACAGAPADPTPTPKLPAPVVNTPPVISSLTTNAAARMEVGQDVAVSAVVTDADVSPDKLTYAWTATAGTFTGTGRSVTWRLAKGAATTPVDVTITLLVTEVYEDLDASGAVVQRKNQVTQSAKPFRVHDSVGELSKMAVTFLVDYFGNSAISPDACLVDFSDSCQGKADERLDIVHNRANFVILAATVKVDSVSLNPSLTTADVWVSCTFRSFDKQLNQIVGVGGDCYLSGVYERQRWWLCDSHLFNGYSIPTLGVSAGVTDPDLLRRFFGGRLR